MAGRVRSVTAGGRTNNRNSRLRPGQVISHYEIVSLLGKGGMGQVYLARDTKLGRRVALKVLTPKTGSLQEQVRRFIQEARLASTPSHPNIAHVYELAEEGGLSFIVMEYVDGITLRQHLAGRRPSYSEIIDISVRIASALSAAHESGIVHRDIKPENIMLKGDTYVKVLDFGLAKLTETINYNPEAMTMIDTEQGTVLGTPPYMSPEQVRAENLDAKTDTWSFGVVLYEMIAGRLPFAGKSMGDTFASILEHSPEPLSSLRGDVPAELQQIVTNSLRKNKDERLTAKEILAHLDQLKQRLVIERSFPPSAPEPTVATLPIITKDRRPPRSVRSLIAVLLIAAILPGAFIYLKFFAPLARTRQTVAVNDPRMYLAVLPFQVPDDEPSLGYLGYGIADALSSKLLRSKGVSVASSAAVQGAKKDSLRELARELGVNHIVNGTLRRSAQELRVSVRIENVADGRRLMNQEFFSAPDDFFALVEKIYSEFISVLKLSATDVGPAGGTARPTTDAVANDFYLRGRAAMRHQDSTKEIESTIQLFMQALERDPSFAQAHAGLADACLAMYLQTKDRLWYDKALNAAQQAQALNSDLPEVHFSLGTVYTAAGKSDEAIAELMLATSLAPNSDEGYRRLGRAYTKLRKKAEAIEAYGKAIELAPHYYNNHYQLGEAYIEFNENEKALDAFRRVIELVPDNYAAYDNLGAAYFYLGRWTECLDAWNTGLSLNPDPGQADANIYSNMGTAYFYLKRYAEAVEMFEKAVNLNPTVEQYVGNLADGYRWNGQKEKAQTTYAKAISLAYQNLQVNPRDASTLGSLALYYAKKGEPDTALKHIRKARSISPDEVQLIYSDFIVQALARRYNEALTLLREAFLRGYPAEEAKNDPELQELRERPEFDSLLQEFEAQANKQ